VTIFLAWLLDLSLGEPPVRLHPVVWMGAYLRAIRKHLPPTLLAGALAWLVGAVLVGGVAFGLNWFIHTLVNLTPISPNLQSFLTSLCLAPLLKPLFAWRALREAALAVLNAPDLAQARRMLAWHLVSRD
jgi:adenosylcobinamide-phosphate synthase